MLPLSLSLVSLVILAWLAGNRPAAGAAVILLANWCACALFSWATGSATMWVALAAIDFLAALAIAFTATRYPQVVLVGTYVVMLLAHAAYGSKGPFGLELHPYYYFQALTVFAWLQVAIVTGWVGYDRIRASGRRDDRMGGAQTDPLVYRVEGKE